MSNVRTPPALLKLTCADRCDRCSARAPSGSCSRPVSSSSADTTPAHEERLSEIGAILTFVAEG